MAEIDVNNPSFGEDETARPTGKIDRHPSADAVIKLRDLLAKHIVLLGKTAGSYIEGHKGEIRQAANAHKKATEAFIQTIVQLDADLGAWQREEKEMVSGEYLHRKLDEWINTLPEELNPLRRQAAEAIQEAGNAGLFDPQKAAFIKQGGNRRDYEQFAAVMKLVKEHDRDLLAVDASENPVKASIFANDPGKHTAILNRSAANTQLCKSLSDLCRQQPVDINVLTARLDTLVKFAEQHPLPSASRKDYDAEYAAVPFANRLKDAVAALKYTQAFINFERGGVRQPG